MSNTDKLENLERLRKQANSRSPKPYQRLMASLAQAELDRSWRKLPGSVRRGVTRGNRV
jgi:hypothetical protein